MASVFGQVEAEWWNAPLIRLPDRATVRDYLIARYVAPEAATAAAGQVDSPVTVTKRGVVVYARSPHDRPDEAVGSDPGAPLFHHPS